MAIRSEDVKRAMEWAKEYGRMPAAAQITFANASHPSGEYICDKCGKTVTDAKLVMWKMKSGPMPNVQSDQCPNTALGECPAKISFAEDALKAFKSSL
jgi:hypothetical protein